MRESIAIATLFNSWFLLRRLMAVAAKPMPVTVPSAMSPPVR